MRGGRGGFGRGGARGGRKAPNGTSHDAGSFDESLDDQGELGEMKKKYPSELVMLKDMFPDWTDVDLLFALDEADGDLPSTVDMITEGNVSQFAEVKKPKDRARSKAADGFSTAGASEKPAFAARGGRGRGGIEGSRGRGGRGSDRARGGFRGGRGGHATTNGAPKEATTASVPTTESSAWDTPATSTEASTNAWNNTAADAQKDTTSNAWSNVASTEAAPAEPTPAAAPDASKISTNAEAPPKKSWASMFAQPKPAPVAIPKQAPKPAPQAPAPVAEPAPAVAEQAEQPAVPAQETTPATTEPVNVAPAVGTPPVATPEPAAQTPQTTSTAQDATPATPHEPLTQENVEHLPDDSHPPSTLTAASTIGSNDPRNLTPVPGQQPPIGRPPAAPVGGFATSAQRAAASTGRSASFQRRVQEQQEAVVMPGHNAVDRAAVQFGSMGLNGEPGPDVDEEREEPETRQAPQHSPPTQPKASLPTAPRQAVAPQEPTAPEGLPTPKQAPGLGPASQQNQPQNQTQPQESVIGQGLPQEPTHLGQNYNQYAAYGQAGMQQDAAVQQQKPYDPFSHQAQYDRFGTQPQQPSHSGFGGLSSAPTDYSSYYTADPQRNAYGGYYGSSYAPQDMRAQAQQDAGLSQQRSTSGFGAASTDSAFGAQAQQQVGHPSYSHYSQPKSHRNNKRHQGAVLQAQSDSGSSDETFWHTAEAPASGPPHLREVTNYPEFSNQQSSQVFLSDKPSQQTQSRYGDAPGSGHNTPNPIAGTTQSVPSAPQTQHPMHQAPTHHQQYAGFPYGHPYYNSPYQAAYQNQFGYAQPASAYSGYQGKQGGMYGAPYGSSYDQHSASPANAGAFNQNQQTSMRSTSGLGGSGLDDYARTSAQSGSLNQTSGFGGVADPFARTTSGFGQSTYAQQPGMTSTAQDESLKPFNESKSGPSPSLGQPGRPGSAANSVVGSSQTGMPQQQQAQQQAQQQQSAFGGYGGFPSQGNQYGGLGGLGGQQGGMGGQGGYGAYGASAFGQYGGYGSRGGWGQSYGAH